MGELNVQIICDDIFFETIFVKEYILAWQLIICFSVLMFMDVVGLTNDNKRSRQHSGQNRDKYEKLPIKLLSQFLTARMWPKCRNLIILSVIFFCKKSVESYLMKFVSN